MQEPVTPAVSGSGTGSNKGSAFKGEDFTTFIKALTEKYGLFEGRGRVAPPQLSFERTPGQSRDGNQNEARAESQSQKRASSPLKRGKERAEKHVHERLGDMPRSLGQQAQPSKEPNIVPPSVHTSSPTEPKLDASNAMPDSDRVVTASCLPEPPEQLPSLDTPFSPSLSQSPTLPSSGSEGTSERQPRAHFQGPWHPPDDSIEAPRDNFFDPSGGVDSASDLSALPSSPRSPFSSGTNLPGFSSAPHDHASVQATSHAAPMQTRTPRLPPRRLSVLPGGGMSKISLAGIAANEQLDTQEDRAFRNDDRAVLEELSRFRQAPAHVDPSSPDQVQQGSPIGPVSHTNELGRQMSSSVGQVRQGEEGEKESLPSLYFGVQGVGGWVALNRSLRDNGFGALRSPNESGFLEDVQAVFRDVLKQYERRGVMVQELLAHNESGKQEQSQKASEMQRLSQEKEALESRVESLEHHAREAAEGVEQADANVAERLRKLEAANASLQQRCSQLQHLARAKERAAQKLQDKLEEGILKEEKRRNREKDIYEKLKRTLAADARGRGVEDRGRAAAVAARELQPTVLVGLYEAQRETTEAELRMLRQELGAAHAELRDKDNLIMRKDRAGGWRTLDVGLLLEKQMAAEKAAKDKALELAALEASLAEKQQDANRRVADSAKRAEQLAEESANLRLELEARPSVRDFKETQRVLARLTRKLEAMRRKQGPWSGSDSDEDALSDAEQEEALGRKQERLRPTRERIARDRNVHRLRLKKLDKLPKELLLEALQDVCIQLEVSELSVLPSAVDKMLRVIAAVPRMERFISDVCSIVFLEGPPIASTGGTSVQRTPDAVPSILRNWIATLGRVRELEDFQAVIATELAKRPEGRQTVQGAHTARNSAAAVADLVGLEREWLMKEATFRQAEGLVAADPERLIHKMLAHFQRLFEVPRLDGVFARINTVYTQYSEYHNFLRALRSLLGLPDNAGSGACIARIRTLLDKDGQSRALVPEYVMGDKTAWGAADAAGAGHDRASSTGDDHLYKEVVEKLLELFHQNDAKHLVASCETVLSRLQRHTQVLPRYQNVINELYDSLRVATLDAIVPAVKALKSE